VDSESRLRLQTDEPSVRAFLSETGGDILHRDEDPEGFYWVTLQPRAEVDPFIARMQWFIYPDRTPSVTFATTIGGGLDPAGWPAAPGYRQGTDICKPFTAEGQAVHPEWRTGIHAWPGTGNMFLYVVEILQGDIDRVDGRRAAA
jgi:hypothetical protein